MIPNKEANAGAQTLTFRHGEGRKEGCVRPMHSGMMLLLYHEPLGNPGANHMPAI